MEHTDGNDIEERRNLAERALLVESGGGITIEFRIIGNVILDHLLSPVPSRMLGCASLSLLKLLQNGIMIIRNIDIKKTRV